MCYPSGFLASLINRNWSEARQEIQPRFIGAPASEGRRRNNRFPCLFSYCGEQASSLYGQRVGCVSRGQAGGPPWVFCPPLRLCNVQGACRVSTLLCSKLFRSGCWAFWSLCIFCLEFAQKPRRPTVIFSSIQFLCILLLVGRCVQEQALQHWSIGSQSQPVSVWGPKEHPPVQDVTCRVFCS